MYMRESETRRAQTAQRQEEREQARGEVSPLESITESPQDEKSRCFMNRCVGPALQKVKGLSLTISYSGQGQSSPGQCPSPVNAAPIGFPVSVHLPADALGILASGIPPFALGSESLFVLSPNEFLIRHIDPTLVGRRRQGERKGTKQRQELASHPSG